MGGCESNAIPLTPEQKTNLKIEKDSSNQINKEIEKEKIKDNQIIKLLLLGAGESGKSTLFKQAQLLYGSGLPDKERATYKPIVHKNVIIGMQTLIQHSEKYGPIDRSLETEKKKISELKGEEAVTPEIARWVKKLWADPGIQKTYMNRAHFQIIESARYFIERVDEVAKDDYLPTKEDVMRSRVQTFGIVETEFIIHGNTFKMFDVGGQRNQRKKWIHCFEKVTAVIFVAAISEFDQTLAEDETFNRVQESLNLFSEICNSRWFVSTNMILFLNKRDLLEDKLTRVPLSQYFPEYKGDNSYDDACDFFKSLFESKNRKPKEKTVYTHITCATDTTQIHAIFEAVTDIIIKASIDASGLG